MTEAQPAVRTQLDAYLADLEELWAAYDELYGTLDADGWKRPYGKNWTFADQPYHMAYFDEIITARPIEAGPDLPEDERWALSSQRQIDEWNAREFAKRPAGETGPQSLERMHAAHDRIRNALTGLTDADLDARLVWSYFFGGMFVPLRLALDASRLHNWGELSELKFRLKRTTPEAPPTATHAGVGMYLFLMTLFCKPERATKPFTIGWELTGPGGGSWTTRVAAGHCTLTEAKAEKPDVRITTTPDWWNIVLLRQAVNPMKAMLTGKLKVKGKTKMGRMRKLFPPPDPDTPLTMGG